MSYFIGYWNEDIPNERKVKAALRRIDPSVTLVNKLRIPVNRVRAWIERPNDGCNDYGYKVKTNSDCRQVVQDAIEGAKTR